jgi:glycosyltransferase involved in cell wall biosynthesis
MKVVVDFRKYDGVVGGVEQGAIQISKYLAKNNHNVILVCKKNMHDEVEEIFTAVDNLKIMALDVLTHAMSIKNIWIDSSTIQEIAVSENADIIHFFYNWSFPFRKKVPSVLTLHDVIPFSFREAMGLFRNLLLYKPGIRKACRLNNMIATVSEFSKRDIAEKIGVPLEKIRVIPNGLREPHPPNRQLEKLLQEKHKTGQDFILNVGGIHERKNIIRLIYAFSELVNLKNYSGKLVITGNISGKPYQNKMKKLCDAAIDKTGMKEKIIFTGFISEAELDSLFRMTKILIYPSLYEGFGIPILEAMKMGVPVITSNTSAMPEVASGAAYLIDADDTQAMTHAMSRLIENDSLRQELIDKGKNRVLTFTWENSAEKYLQLYHDVIKVLKKFG